MNLTETEKAYLAGLFDGEGHIGYYKNTTGYGNFNLMVTITNTDHRVMKWLKDKLTIGKISPKQKTHNKPAWTWQIRNSHDAFEFLQIILPYLVIKKDQADLLLSLLDAEQKIPRIRGQKRISDELLTQRFKLAADLKVLKHVETFSIH